VSKCISCGRRPVFGSDARRVICLRCYKNRINAAFDEMDRTGWNPELLKSVWINKAQCR